VASIQEQIISAAYRWGVDPEVALAVAEQESGLNQGARGSSGEIGIFQLMPGTAAGLGVNPYDVGQNIDGGVRYLGQQYQRFGSWDLALAAYNAGPGRVAAGTIPASTQGYVNAILASLGLQDGWGSPEPVLAAGGSPEPPWSPPLGSSAGLWLGLGVAGLVGLLLIRD
jgi:hypothetical protein